MQPVTVLVCGEPMRGDDAVAMSIVDALPPSTRALAEVLYVGAPMPEHLVAVSAPVILVDAVEGPEPGTVIDLPLDELAEAARSDTFTGSSHALPMATVLGIVESIGGSLPPGRFIGVAGRAFELGAHLSPPAREGVEPAAARLAHWIRVLAHSAAGAA